MLAFLLVLLVGAVLGAFPAAAAPVSAQADSASESWPHVVNGRVLTPARTITGSPVVQSGWLSDHPYYVGYLGGFGPNRMLAFRVEGGVEFRAGVGGGGFVGLTGGENWSDDMAWTLGVRAGRFSTTDDFREVAFSIGHRRLFRLVQPGRVQSGTPTRDVWGRLYSAHEDRLADEAFAAWQSGRTLAVPASSTWTVAPTVRLGSHSAARNRGPEYWMFTPGVEAGGEIITWLDVGVGASVLVGGTIPLSSHDPTPSHVVFGLLGRVTYTWR